MPGIAFVLARRAALQASEGWARSVSLDLVAQWRGFESSGQFRFTPPTHVVLAFAEALRELEEEGGIEVRRDRYQSNHVALMAGMHSLGFRPVLSPALASPIIASFHTPQDARFNFEQFYTRLAERGLIIYPGKLAKIDSFRIGTIGHLFPADVDDLLKEIASALAAMQVVLLLNR